MWRRMLRRIEKWFNNECRTCGYQRTPQWRPFCSQLCREEHLRRQGRRFLTDAEIREMELDYVFYKDPL